MATERALVDGNKRLGWLATAVFLELDGVKASRLSNGDVFELVIWVASSNPDLADITRRLHALIRPAAGPPPDEPHERAFQSPPPSRPGPQPVAFSMK